MKPQRGRVWIGVAWLLSIVLEEKKAKGPKNEKVEKAKVLPLLTCYAAKVLIR